MANEGEYGRYFIDKDTVKTTEVAEHHPKSVDRPSHFLGVQARLVDKLHPGILVESPRFLACLFY